MLKYVGKGGLPGIPARDLTKEDIERYGGKETWLALGIEESKIGDSEEMLLATGLYEKMGKPKPKENKLLAPKAENKDGE